jgi:capsular polysaccharide transport system permease protein
LAGDRTTHRRRSDLEITLSVWRALFLRESLSRLFSSRGAWFWLLAEPVFHVAYLMFLFSVVRVRNVGGIDVGLWIMLGLLAFFAFRRTGTQAMNAIGSNLGLFTYRQVKPVDTALVRAALEGVLIVVVSFVLLAGAGMLGREVLPAEPLLVAEAFFGLWLLGLGFGLATSVAVQLAPEVGRVIGLAMMPLYLISGVIYPVSVVPQPYRTWLMFNPVAHGLEATRLAFAPHYHAAPELSVGYLYGFALTILFLGLALQRRFAVRLAAL